MSPSGSYLQGFKLVLFHEFTPPGPEYTIYKEEVDHILV